MTKLHGLRTAKKHFRAWIRLCALVMAAAAASGCGGNGNRNDGTPAAAQDVYTLEVTKDRKVKDLHFLQDESSPLSPEDRQSFRELDYFPPDRAFAFPTVLERLTVPRRIVMATSKDRPREMLHIGHLPITFEGEVFRLQVFMPRDTAEEKYWFIPFTDATSGKETYPGGRYIDMDETASDSVFLDFNYSYNPWCAYNPRFDCPIPPEANRLPFAVRAGEKAFKHR